MRIRAFHRDFNEVTIFCILPPVVTDGNPIAVFTYGSGGYLGYDSFDCFSKCMLEEGNIHITSIPTVHTVRG